MNNALIPFAFENHVAHGAIVRLQAGVGELFDQRQYAPDVRDLLGQALAAMPLFATHLSFEGRINLQFQSLPETRTIQKAQTELLVAQIDHEYRVRAMAKAPGDAAGSFRELLEGGVLALMIEPSSGSRSPTQALVMIEGERLENAVEQYFARSEQLPTLVRLAVRGNQLAGFLLQRLPLESANGGEEDWEHLRVLASTLKHDELLDTDPDRLLLNLFADAPQLRRFDARPVEVRCNCRREGIARMLMSLGREEVNSILAEQGKVSVTCEFCGKDYVFDETEAVELFLTAGNAPTDTRH